jgi:hypothetical protein
MLNFYPTRFRIRKKDYSYFIAKLVKVSVMANGLHKKSHCSLCGGAMAEQVFPDFFYCKILHKDLLLL